MTLDELSKKTDGILSEIPDRSFDKFCIFEDIGNITREQTLIHPEAEIDEGQAEAVLAAAQKRADGYPLQYILGKWEFFGNEFSVGEGVLIPRPDTECLVETVISKLGKKKPPYNIVDLCSGSGCIAVSVAKEMAEKAQVFAVELSDEAFSYLVKNVSSNNVKVRLLKGDVMNGALLDNFKDETGGFMKIDCIVSNPPYLTDDEMNGLQREVRFEPETALYGGNDGLKFYRVISCLWKEILADDGLMIFEIGTEQAMSVRKILIDSGFKDIFTVNDATGGVRVIGGSKSVKNE